MKWFDERKNDYAGSDSDAPASDARKIAQIADDTLDGETMVRFVHEFFLLQRSFGEFIGVGESTVAGWMKNAAFPDYAKRAALAAYYAEKHYHALKEATRDAQRPRVVKDGDRYLIVQFDADETGVSIGRVIARDIPSEKAALVLAGSVRAWDLLGEAERFIDDHIVSRGLEGRSSWIEELQAQIHLERNRAFKHEELLEIEKDSRRRLEERRRFAEKLDPEMLRALLDPAPDVQQDPAASGNSDKEDV